MNCDLCDSEIKEYKDGIYLVERKTGMRHPLQRHEGVWYYFWHKDGKPQMKVYTDATVTRSFHIIRTIDKGRKPNGGGDEL